MLPSNFNEKSNYTNQNILYLFNRVIYEYDIHSADINLCRYYNILPKETIEKISNLDKMRRVVKIGKLQKEKEFRDKLKKAFEDIRKEFYDSNKLDINDILAVKKDAIFTTTSCGSVVFGPVEFQVKNIYTSYIQLPNRIEIYYNSNGKCDIKGIDDEVVKLHNDGIMKVIINFFKKMETGSTMDVLKYLNRVSTSYKLRELPLEYYREFNNNSKYTITGSEDTYDEFWEESKDELNIMYNFINVLIPLVKIPL